jgi:CRISPR-associated protein Csd1
MIKELCEFGIPVCEKKYGHWNHVALKEEPISIELVLDNEGNFKRFEPIEKIPTIAEALNSKKGSARLLLDKAEEVLCFGGKDSLKKHTLFLEKLRMYQHLPALKPVVAFYGDNKANGLNSALSNFSASIPEKARGGNIGFRIQQESVRIHEKSEVRNEIITVYVEKKKDAPRKKCAVCGLMDFPVEDEPHGMVKNVPTGKSSGCALVSYNASAFESFGFKGNDNSAVCASCARKYVEGLGVLFSEGVPFKNENKKDDVLYLHRWPRRRSAGYGLDSTILFWTRSNLDVPEMDQLDAPDADSVAKMISAVSSGNRKDIKYIETEQFYSCTLSGAAARIAVRDWIETSVDDFRVSIAQWFNDIAIISYDFDQKKSITHYSSLYALAKSCQRKLLDGNKYDDDDTTWARMATHLWKAAIHNNTRRSSPIPIWILSKVLQRAKMDKGSGKAKSLAQFSKYGVTPERAALIRLILNRNFAGGGFMVTEDSIQGEKPIAYICGEIFAKMESIQFATLGERNAGIREKFFSYAMTTPASAFGRLFNLNSKHFTKLKHEKPGLAVNLDKELQELCRGIDINKFPAMFRLEQQGQFAIGYYHQRQKQFADANTK